MPWKLIVGLCRCHGNMPLQTLPKSIGTRICFIRSFISHKRFLLIKCKSRSLIISNSYDGGLSPMRSFHRRLPTKFVLAFANVIASPLTQYYTLELRNNILCYRAISQRVGMVLTYQSDSQCHHIGIKFAVSS